MPDKMPDKNSRTKIRSKSGVTRTKIFSVEKMFCPVRMLGLKLAGKPQPSCGFYGCRQPEIKPDIKTGQNNYVRFEVSVRFLTVGCGGAP
jgi:hypothetical protein